MVNLTRRATAAALALALARLTFFAVPPASSAPASRTPAPAASAPRLVPEPRELELGTGRFALDQRLTIAVPSSDAEDLFAAGLLAAELRAAGGSEPTIATGGSGTIVLDRDPKLTEAGEQGYRLEVRSSAVRVTARTATGLFYGVQTLRQLIEPGGIPVVTIADRPALAWRGVHDDISRGPLPTLEALERRVELLAEFKINLYALYSENAIAYRSHPLLAAPGGALSQRELKTLAEHARRHHVALLIEQQCFGHLDRALALETYQELAERSGSGELAPVTAPSLAFAESLIAEAAPLSTAPFVHVGGDEMTDVGSGQSRAAVQERGLGTLYLERIARLRAVAARSQKRLMFWSDFAESHPEVVPKLPKDAVIAVWDYESAKGFDKKLAPFRAAGLEVFACPGVENWNRIFPNLGIAIPNIRGFSRAAQEGDAAGALVCSWNDNGEALFGSNWYPLLYGAAAAWKEGDCDPERFAAAFDWALFRNPGRQAADAIVRVSQAHDILRELRPMDATTELSWVNPARGNLDRQLLAMIAPAARRLRLDAEQSLIELERARTGARRNADLLDYVALAARRVHVIGHRALLAERMKALYADALAHQKDDAKSDRAVKPERVPRRDRAGPRADRHAARRASAAVARGEPALLADQRHGPVRPGSPGVVREVRSSARRRRVVPQWRTAPVG
jgi:hypothetical protein